jgi:hypothetical protein
MGCLLGAKRNEMVSERMRLVVAAPPPRGADGPAAEAQPAAAPAAAAAPAEACVESFSEGGWLTSAGAQVLVEDPLSDNDFLVDDSVRGSYCPAMPAP